jgi:hypothetical protein
VYEVVRGDWAEERTEVLKAHLAQVMDINSQVNATELIKNRGCGGSVEGLWTCGGSVDTGTLYYCTDQQLQTAFAAVRRSNTATLTVPVSRRVVTQQYQNSLYKMFIFYCTWILH